MHDAPCAGAAHAGPAARQRGTRRASRTQARRRTGAVSVAEVILNVPWEAASMTIAELLTSQRQWGTIRSRKFLTGIGIAETKTIASLTERQRSLLATMV
jgi:hypothetical protein